LQAAPQTIGRRSILRILAIAWLGATALASPMAAAQPGEGAPEASPTLLSDDTVCLGCHEDATDAPDAPEVESDEILDSVHASLACFDCHDDPRTIPHERDLGAVDCARCHEPAAAGMGLAALSRHKRIGAVSSEEMPTCTDCHGAHVMHRALNPAPSEKRHMVEPCARCHQQADQEYWRSSHGTALHEQNPDAPTCGSCHPEHLRRGERERSGVFEKGAVETCVFCHDDPGMQDQYALPAGRLTSYLGSYHGTARQLGDTRTANCVSCHGQHEILPSTDVRSSTHPQNLERTCGGCHPGVTENVAKGKIHILPSPESDRLLYYIHYGFKWFTLAIIGALVGHIALDLFGRWRGRGED
jgi:cytochrome c553